MSKRFPTALVIVAVLIVGGCDGDDGAATTSAGPSPASLEQAEQLEAVVRGYDDGWIRGDFDLIASFLDDDEFVFNEPGAVNLDKDGFMALMRPFVGNPSVDAADVHYFVGDDEVIWVGQAWGFGGGTSEKNPVVEVDVFTVRNGAILALRSMYGAEFVRRLTGVEGAAETMAAYASAWSSGDPSEVESLYVDDAVRVEPLSDRRLQGADEIVQAARERFARQPDPSIDVVEPYVFTSADTLPQTFGAMFVVDGDPSCKVLVMLEPSESGQIAREHVYPHTETLEACRR